MDQHPVRRWNIKDSPRLTLNLLGVPNIEKANDQVLVLVKEELSKLNDSDLEALAHLVATRRQRSGEDFDEVYSQTLDHYRREREAALHAQPA